MFTKLKQKISANRMTYLSISAVVVIGNTLTGWDVISWVLYLPAILLPIAAITGVCPFKIAFVKLGFPSHNENDKFCNNN
jgi:hypothetical protein